MTSDKYNNKVNYSSGFLYFLNLQICFKIYGLITNKYVVVHLLSNTTVNNYDLNNNLIFCISFIYGIYSLCIRIPT